MLVFAGVASAELDTFSTGDGHEGAYTLPAGTTNLNYVAPLTAAANAGSNSLTIGAVRAGGAGAAATQFEAGRLVMIFQTSGFPSASAVSGNQADLSIGSSQTGTWELARIAGGYAGGSTLPLTAPLVNSFAASGAQVIAVPEFTTVTGTGSNTLSALPWNGASGGVTAFLASGAISLTGTIEADFAGFRAGALYNGVLSGCTQLDGSVGGGKGEGIVLGAYGVGFNSRGNRANGAGGGDCENAGGGGGGNGGTGGIGGMSYDGGGRVVGGLGGEKLIYSAFDHASLGGGGGAGDENNNNGGVGGTGGGFVFMRGASLAGSGTIAARGADGAESLNVSASDGSGGGGAGGVVYARFTGSATCAQATVAGGAGGNEHSTAGVHGPGGGGAGGRMVLQSTGGSCATNVSNGIGGIVYSGTGGNRGSGPSASSDPVSSGGTETTSGGMTAPTASVTAPADGGYVNSTTPAITGTATAAATVRVTIDGAYAGSVIADAGGNWIYTPSALSVASHSVTVTPVYTGIAGAATTAVNFTIDLTSPAVTVTPPNPLTSSGAAQAVVFTATDNVAVASRQCKLDAGAYAACSSPFNTGALSAGVHTVYVQVTDSAGNVTTQSATITVDQTNPVVTVNPAPSPTTGSTASQNISFSATDANGISGYRCKLNAGAYAACTSPFATGTLAAGLNTITVEATDGAGNTATGTTTITVDAAAPVVTVNAAPSPLTKLTTAQSITFSATSGVGITGYRCKLNAAAYAACTSPWSTGVLAVGLNTIYVEATDSGGKTSVATTTITVDQTLPVVTVNAAPAPLTKLTTSQSISFSATDANGVASYRCKLNAAAYAACTSPFATGTLAVGANTITVEATDSAGNVATGTTSITVDQTVPVVTVNAAPAPLTNSTNSQNISFSATDANGVSGYRCKLNAAAYAACTSPFATGTLVVGANTVSVEATDNAGNVAVGTVVITVDQTNPVVTVNAAPAPLTKLTTSQSISFSATDANGIAAYRCQLNGGVLTTCTSPFATGTLAVGTNTVTIEATDNAGNVATNSTTITVDQTNPVVTVNSAPSPLTNATTSQNISFSATDANGVASSRCKLNAAAYAACTSPFATGTLTVGANTITVEATDNAGNVATNTTSITVDQTLPVVTVNAAPSPLTNSTNSQTISFSATDANGISGYRCKLNAAAFAACTSPFATGTLAVGANTITVEATDNAGNVATGTASISVDQTVPVVTVNAAPAPLTKVTTTQNITFSATDANGISGYRCKLNAAAYAACTSPFATGTLAVGTNTITVEATDNAGNVATGTTSITVDQTLPVVTVNAAPSPLTKVTTTQNITFSATDTSGISGYRCKLNAAAFAACTSPFATGTLAVGANTITVEATDNAGNVATNTTSITVDQTNPVVTVNTAPSPTANDTGSQNISFSATDANGISGYRCKLNAGAYAACTSPFATGTLAVGANTITVEATDNAGNVATGTTSITVDLAAPDVTVDPAPTPLTGSTSAQSITFSATSGAGITGYRCKLNAAAYAACTSPWSTGTLAVGVNTITVEATDGAAKTGTATTTITVDQTVPALTVNTAPAPLTNSTTSQSISFNATDSSGISGYRCKLNAAAFAACSSPFATGTLSVGANTVTVEATDGVGNVATSAITITVDQTTPVVTVNAAPTPLTSSTGAQNITFSASDANGISGYRCKLNAAPYAACASPFSTGTLSLGTNTISVEATDNAGNVAVGTTVITVEQTPPVVTVNAAPAPLTKVTTSQNITFSATDASGISGYRCKLNAAAFAACTSPFATGTLAVGVNTVTVEATDNAGNVATGTTSITVDQTNPVVTVNAAPAALTNASTSQNISFSATDANGVASYRCKLNAAAYAACTSPFATGALTVGANTITVEATDNAGNVATGTTSITVDQTAPALTVNAAPYPLSKVTDSQNISFSATDANGISGYRCKLNAAAYAACTSPFATGTLALGTNTISIEATDNAGNVAVGTTTITVDQTDPVLTVTAPSPVTNVTTTQNVTFSATDANGILLYRCKLNAAAFANCTSPFATGALTLGTNTVTVEAIDNAGNPTTTTATIIVDQTAPVVTVNAAPTPLANSTASQNITFSATDANGISGYRCKLNAGAYAACTSPFATGTLAAGANTITVEATDNAGNVATGTTSITVDQTVPALTVNAAPTPLTSSTTSQNITFSATDANGISGYRCKLNAAAFAACSSPFATGVLAVGTNTITVEATDNAGNVATGTASINVDQTLPAVTVNAAPSPLTKVTTSQSISFSATDANGISGYRCKLNAAAFAACTSPFATGTLAVGTNTITVEATDNAGNVATGTTTIVVDQTAPVVTVNPAPSPSANDTSSQNITFSATDANGVASYRCKLNAGAYAACTSPFATGTLAVGANTITVEATDNAGNVATGTTSITVDLAAPDVTVNAAPSPLTNVTTAQNITFSATSGAGITGYRCKLNGAAYAACTSPWSTGTLAAGVNTITVEATDSAAKTGTATTTINVDQTAPVVTVNAAPTPLTNVTTTQNISFSATDANGIASYRCKLNAAAFAACTSPFATGTLAVGANTITVEATDNAGNVATNSTTITVDQTVPVVTVNAAPTPLTKLTTTQNISFSATDANGVASYRCKLNAAAFAACSSPFATGTLTVGTNTITVEATDNAGNVATNSTTITVDQTNPVVTVNAAPSPVTSATASQNVAFSATDANGVASYRCKLNAAAYAACTSPFATGTLAVGANTITVEATDNAGNVATGTTTITVDQTAPVVTVDPAPAALTNSTASQNISFSATDANGVASYRCKLNGGAFAACSQPWATGTLAVGTNTITVEATDNAGNVATGATVVTVDQTVPVVTVNAAPTPLTSLTTTQNITFSATDANGVSGYRCKLNAAAFAACSSPFTTGTLTVGTNTITVEATDNAGNVATGSTTITVDQTNPVVTVNAAPSPVTNATASQSITFSAADANGVASYRCKLNATAFAACSSPFATGTLAVGLNTVTVEATDNAGNVATGSTTITVDQATPVVTVNAAPSPLTNVTTTQNISFSATDASGISGYRCKLNAAAFAACTSPFATGSLVVGTNTITVEATDNAGNVATGTTTITVDQTNPVVTVNAAPTPLTKLTTTQNISFSATDANGIASYRCKLNAGAYAACASPFATGALTVGTNTITVEATDNAGNVATGTTTITVDQIAPAVSVNAAPSPVTNATTSQNVTFSATDANGIASYRCKLNAAAFAACTSPFATGALVAGSNTITVEATDNAGNVATGSTVITVDQTAPNAPVITAPADGTTTTDSTPAFTGTAEPHSTVQVFAGATQIGTATADAAGSWAFTPSSPLAEGTTAVTARAVDGAGNVSAASAAVNLTIDSIAPVTTIGAQPPANSSSASAHFTFSSDDPAATSQCKLDGASYAACTSPQDFSGLSEGSHTFSVIGTDVAGNTESPAKSYTWTVDLTAPAVPVVSSPTSGQPVNDSTPTVTGTGEPGATITIYVDGSAVGSVTVDGAGNWTYVVSPALSEGSHTVSAKATDAAGNASTQSPAVSFTVDTTPPAVTPPDVTPPVTAPQCDSAPVAGGVAAKMQVLGVSVSRKTLVKFKVSTDQFILARITVKQGSKKLGTSIRAVNAGSRQIVVTIKKLPKKNASLTVRLSSVTMTGGHGVATTALTIDANGKLSLGSLGGTSGSGAAPSASASCGPDIGGARATIKILQAIAVGGKSNLTVTAKANQFAVSTFTLVKDGKTYARTVYLLQPGKKLKKPLKLLGGNKLEKNGKYAMTITSFSADGVKTVVNKTITVK